jgi:hypothetical protein
VAAKIEIATHAASDSLTVDARVRAIAKGPVTL